MRRNLLGRALLSLTLTLAAAFAGAQTTHHYEAHDADESSAKDDPKVQPPASTPRPVRAGPRVFRVLRPGSTRAEPNNIDSGGDYLSGVGIRSSGAPDTQNPANSVSPGGGGAGGSSGSPVISNSTKPTASITVNGGKKRVTVKVGEAVTKTWNSTHGSTYRATWRATGACSEGVPSGTWVAGKTSQGTESYPAQANQAGCTYVITYTVTAANGKTASDSITIVHPAASPAPNTHMCASSGLTNTVLELDWAMGKYRNIDIGKNESVSFPLIIPAASGGGRVTMSYTTGGAEAISISEDMCDFLQTTYDRGCMTAGVQPTMDFQPVGLNVARCTLTPGKQYYVNVRNAVVTRGPVFPIQDSCKLSKCTGVMSFSY